MASVELQLHAAPEELVSVATRFAEDAGLQAISERFFPEYVCRRAQTSAIGHVDRVSLCSSLPQMGAHSAFEFTTLNADCLFVSIGQMDQNGLRESSIGGATARRSTLATWRLFLAQIRSVAHRGARVRNPISGFEQPEPHHLHLDGAHRLAERGVAMLAAAGWNEFAFDDLPL